MEVILLERVGKLGQMGETVRVKDGFARNFLLPRGKALRATADNKKKFEGMRAELETRNLESKGEAGKLASKIDGKNFIVLRQASESGQLFGSVTTRDIARLIAEDGANIAKGQVAINAPIKSIGQYKVPLALHPEIEVAVTVIVARSADEAARIPPQGRHGSLDLVQEAGHAALAFSAGGKRRYCWTAVCQTLPTPSPVTSPGFLSLIQR